MTGNFIADGLNPNLTVLKPIKHFSILAIAGPDKHAKLLRNDLIRKELFNKVHVFSTPSDCGDFPDTTGYTQENWGEIELLNEDPALFQVMTKCMDCVLEYVNRKYIWCCDNFAGRVEKHVQWPKFGGSLFAVAGNVTVFPARIEILH